VLYESEVVDAVSDHLKSHGWTEVRRVARTRAPGIDLEMQIAGALMYVEAKGATSEDPTSKRYGKEFNGGQVNSHVSRAVLTALKWASSGSARPGVALPDNPENRAELGPAMLALHGAEIGIFWVSDDRSVTTDCPWEL
jgi:hypothetical protein